MAWDPHESRPGGESGPHGPTSGDQNFGDPAAVKVLVASREVVTGHHVPYEWVVQAGRRELNADRPRIESAVESLVEHEELEKCGPEFLTVKRE